MLPGTLSWTPWTPGTLADARMPAALYTILFVCPRGMGGTLSPTVGTLTEQSGPGVAEAWQEGAEDELELMYDPQLNCFYDPHTCKYYELAQ